MDELFASEGGVSHLIDLFDKAEFDGVLKIHAVMAPAAFPLSGFAAEGVEERIGAVVGGPDAKGEIPSDAPGSGGPKRFGIGMKSKLIEADISTIGAQGMGV